MRHAVTKREPGMLGEVTRFAIEADARTVFAATTAAKEGLSFEI